MASTEQATAIPLSLQAFNRLSMSQKLGAMVVVALSVALLAGTWLWSRSIDYSILFSNVSDSDGGAIIASLQQMNVPYKFAEHGSAILVPATQVHETRLKLASQGLPKGGLVGFDILENQKLGTSQFLEQVNYQRALEGELARTIQSLAAVRAARVHLAIPKQSAFLRDEQKPTASVVVYLLPGRTLEAGQISGIVHLISSAVPQLTPENVSVIDGSGNLISQSRDPLRDAGLDPSQLKYEHEVEAGYVKRIESILEPFVGPGNVRAQVTADLDFSQTEQVAESYQPNPAPNTAIRSEQTSETGSAVPGAIGVPGALTNQPPVPATAPLTTPPVAGAVINGTSQTGGKQLENFNKNATINYELDKTIKHTKDVPGSIKRLSVAVVVNDKESPPRQERQGQSDAFVRHRNEADQRAGSGSDGLLQGARRHGQCGQYLVLAQQHREGGGRADSAVEESGNSRHGPGRRQVSAGRHRRPAALEPGGEAAPGQPAAAAGGPGGGRPDRPDGTRGPRSPGPAHGL